MNDVQPKTVIMLPAENTARKHMPNNLTTDQ